MKYILFVLYSVFKNLRCILHTHHNSFGWATFQVLDAHGHYAEPNCVWGSCGWRGKTWMGEGNSLESVVSRVPVMTLTF